MLLWLVNHLILTITLWVNTVIILILGLPRWDSGEESACQCWWYRRHGFDPWVRKIPWRRKWQPTPVFLPGESHGQRSLVGYSPWGRKESDMTERTHTHKLRFKDSRRFDQCHTASKWLSLDSNTRNLALKSVLLPTNSALKNLQILS